MRAIFLARSNVATAAGSITRRTAANISSFSTLVVCTTYAVTASILSPYPLFEDEIASAYRATIYAELHKSLYERLHQVLLSQQRQRKRQHSPDQDPISTFARPVFDQHIQHASACDPVARQPSPADRSCLDCRRASETHDEQDVPSKQPRYHHPSARLCKRTARPGAYQSPSMLPDRADTLLSVAEAEDPF
jgi:hypothetical protein